LRALRPARRLTGKAARVYIAVSFNRNWPLSIFSLSG
jgi:hypothetical protein